MIARLDLIHSLRQASICDNYKPFEYFQAAWIADLILAGVGRIKHTNIEELKSEPPGGKPA